MMQGGDIVIPCGNIEQDIQQIYQQIDALYHQVESISVLNPINLFFTLRRLVRQKNELRTEYSNAIAECHRRMRRTASGPGATQWLLCKFGPSPCVHQAFFGYVVCGTN